MKRGSLARIFSMLDFLIAINFYRFLGCLTSLEALRKQGGVMFLEMAKNISFEDEFNSSLLPSAPYLHPV